MKKKKGHTIFITGSVRSGSTWVLNILSMAPSVKIYGEPFAFYNEQHYLGSDCIQRYFPFFTQKERKSHFDAIQNGLGLQFTLKDLWRHVHNSGTMRAQLRACKKYGMFHLSQRGYTPIVKDPHAIFNAEWFYEEFKTLNVLLIRHPAAFISSLKRMGWQIGVNIYQQQTELVESLIPEFKDEIWGFQQHRDIVEEGILYWNIIHSLIYNWKLKYPDWIFMKHEELSADPLSNFKGLFDKLDLEFTHDVENEILKSTNSFNPTEAKKGNIHTLNRNSKENIKSWKNRLSPVEIDRIKSGTQHISKLFYNEEDWS